MYPSVIIFKIVIFNEGPAVGTKVLSPQIKPICVQTLNQQQQDRGDPTQPIQQ
jgi:hypothetical protein